MGNMDMPSRTLRFYFMVYAVIIITGCAGGQILDKPNARSKPYSVILNHTRLDPSVQLNSSLPSSYADIVWIWPLWSSQDSKAARYSRDHGDLYVTGGWFYIEYSCPEYIYTDHGNESIIHIETGHLYRFECGLHSPYESIKDLGAISK